MKAFIDWFYNCTEWQFAFICGLTFYIAKSFIIEIIKAFKSKNQ